MPPLKFQLILVALLSLPAAAMAEGPGSAFKTVTIEGQGPATGGSDYCVTVSSTGGSEVAIDIELNGIEVTRVTRTTDPQTGAILICFPIPSAGAGGSVVVTASGDGSFGQQAFVVL